MAECDNTRKCILMMAYMTDGERPQWSSSGENVSLLQTRDRHHGMFNHLCFTLLEQWVCGLGRASRPKSGSFPVKRPSSAALYLRRKLNRLEGPAAFYQSQNSRLQQLFIPVVWAVGEGLASALLSNKMANHLFSVADTTSTVSSAGQGKEEDGTRDGDKPGGRGYEGLMASLGADLCLITLTRLFTLSIIISLEKNSDKHPCQQRRKQNNDAPGSGQSPNSDNIGRWDSVINVGPTAWRLNKYFDEKWD